MASDISLGVGDGARRMTYAELATVRGVSLASARRLVLRHRWPRQTGNDGVVRVTVPLTALRKSPETADFRDTTTPGSVTTTDPAPPDSVSHVPDAMTFERVSTTDAAAAAAVTTTDPLTVIAIQTLSQAVDMLREDLGIANSFLLAEREHAGQAERRIDELQVLLTEERRQAQTSAPDIRGIIKEVIREIAGAAPPDNGDDDRERLQTLESTIAALREQVEDAQSGLVAERQRAEQAEHRVDDLLVALADARTAAMITGYEATALRTRLARLTERRPWWRRWFR
jgi:outer membrane murein-binding lipoprotein Lpp